MLRVAALFAALLGLSLAATAEDKKDTPSEAKLIGKWKLVKNSKGQLPPGLDATIDLQKGGKFKMQMAFMGKTEEGSGTWKLAGKQLTVEYTEGAQKGKKETMTVTKLTDTTFVTEDPKGVTDEFTRVKETKKAPEKK
jgi:uncharacterized protein (TIGR03066 family)